MVIYILTKFGADWLIFVEACINKTDGHRWTVSDHNSSLSTLCSGELKTETCFGMGRNTARKGENAGYPKSLLTERRLK